MIETFFATGNLASVGAFAAALVIGGLFGVTLERAGLGSSRRLAAVFYLRDMTVVKVMFTAILVATLGLSYARVLGLVNLENLYHIPTILGAQAVGGVLFGIGFVMSGWCPGTGAVGLASGKLDALVFLIAAILGGILYNEVYPALAPLAGMGDLGVSFAYRIFNVPEGNFVLTLTLVGIGCLYASEVAERVRAGTGLYIQGRFLLIFCMALAAAALGFMALEDREAKETPTAQALKADGKGEEFGALSGKNPFLAAPEEIAQRLMAAEPDLTVVDLRTPGGYKDFHLRNAVNITPSGLADALAAKKNKGYVVLYADTLSNAGLSRDILVRAGFENVYLLEGGLKGFIERCLKPVSLRSAPLTPTQADTVRAWRAFFLAGAPPAGQAHTEKR